MCMGKKIENAKPLNFNDLAKKEKKIKKKKNSKEVEIHIKNNCRKAGQKLSRCSE